MTSDAPLIAEDRTAGGRGVRASGWVRLALVVVLSLAATIGDAGVATEAGGMAGVRAAGVEGEVAAGIVKKHAADSVVEWFCCVPDP